MRRLVVLRPEPGASTTVEKARAQGLDARAIPLFEIEPLPWEAPEAANFDALLLTSANAVRQAGEKLQNYRGLQAYAVGDATADAARDAGFGIAGTGSAGIDRLLGSIEPDLKLLHLCGEDRRKPEGVKQEITEVPVYRAEQVSEPVLDDVDDSVFLVHSPRAALRLAELAKKRDRATVAAISPAAAQAVGDGWESVETANAATDDALLALAIRLCNKPRS